MPVDPHIQGLLDMLTAMGAPPLDQGTPQSARDGFRLMTVGMRQPSQVVPVGSTEDVTVPGPAGPLRARIYRPEGTDGSRPTLLFVHGGGFVIGDIDTHDNQARALCRGTGAVVVSTEYRLAPEDPWPAAVDDVMAALDWVAGRVDELGGDAKRLAIGGDSAGGNLSAVAAQRASAAGGPRLAAQLLIYPATDMRDVDDYPSRVENATGYFLTEDDMRWFDTKYVPADAERTDPGLSPLLAPSLAGLPPAVVATAEFDPLRDEGDAYARALEAAGVPVRHRQYPGMIHGFFDLGVLSPAAAAAVDAICRDLTELLGTTVGEPIGELTD